MIFNCPICGFTLNTNSCSNCSYKYDNIIYYQPEEDYKYNEFDIEDLKRFNKELKSTNSVKKSLELLESNKDWVERYAIDTSRSTWISFFKEYIGDICLDIGCGFGNNTRVLSKYAKKTYGFDITVERLETLLLLSRNITVAQGNIFSVDIRNKSINTILLIGVLEWLGVSNIGNVKELQIEALKRINGWLKDDGILILAIENRIGIQYFAGAKDHQGTRFTSLLPRKMANFTKKILYSEPYRTYTYSNYGYKKLLRESGFNYWQFYYTFPDYRYPKIICDDDNFNKFKSFLKETHKNLKGALACKVINKLFAPSFYIVASKKPLIKNSNKYFYFKNNNYYIVSRDKTKKVDTNTHD